jgi:serine/threonine-protein kinase
MPAIAAHDPAGLWSESLKIVPETFGERSLFHHRPGVHAVAALVAGARGDDFSQGAALDAFVAAAGAPGEHLDVAFGCAGLLLASSLLLEALPPAIDDAPLRGFGGALHASLAEQVARQPPIGSGQRVRSLGGAHGWAGLLFALLRWAEVTGGRPPGGLPDRLDQLARLGQPFGRGTVWPHDVGESPYANPIAAGWCNGAAGYVPLWTLAHQLTGDDAFARLAETAAWTAYEDPSDAGDLCCGLAGRAYALLNLYRNGGEDIWLARAGHLADRAAVSVRRSALRRDSLYKGEVGVALLAADLEDPLHSCMPLYEGEGWPRRG